MTPTEEARLLLQEYDEINAEFETACKENGLHREPPAEVYWNRDDNMVDLAGRMAYVLKDLIGPNTGNQSTSGIE